MAHVFDRVPLCYGKSFSATGDATPARTSGASRTSGKPAEAPARTSGASRTSGKAPPSSDAGPTGDAASPQDQAFRADIDQAMAEGDAVPLTPDADGANAANEPASGRKTGGSVRISGGSKASVKEGGA